MTGERLTADFGAKCLSFGRFGGVPIRRRPQSGRLGGEGLLALALPTPGQRLVDAVRWMGGAAGEHIGYPGVGIDVVHLGGDYQAVHGGCQLSAPIGSR